MNMRLRDAKQRSRGGRGNVFNLHLMHKLIRMERGSEGNFSPIIYLIACHEVKIKAALFSFHNYRIDSMPKLVELR